eukprot:6601074-Pyramimonas_sp.AAC.1
MRQADASDVSESIPVITSPANPPTARVKCRKPTAHGTSSGSRKSSELRIRKADAPDVSKSISVITSHAASPLQPELSAENRQHLSR